VSTKKSQLHTYFYGPYGELNAASGIRFRYTGQFWLQEIGLYYYKARFYSPALGRFLQTDPVGYQSDLNLYAYVGNDPVNGKDPDGDIPLFFVLPGVGGIINAALQGYEAGLKGATALEIAAAAGKGFISGYAGTAAGIISKSPAVGGAVGGAVENAVSSYLNNGKVNLAEVAKSAAVGAVIGKAAGAAVPLTAPTRKDFVYKTAADFRQTVTNNATRSLDQTVATSAVGGGVQAVSNFSSSLSSNTGGGLTGLGGGGITSLGGVTRLGGGMIGGRK